MKLNQADRAFWSILAVAALAGGGLWAVLCCGLWALAHQIGIGGWSSVLTPSLMPALLLVGFVIVATACAAVSVIRQARATRRLTRELDARSTPLSDESAALADGVGLHGRIQVIDVPEPLAITYGVVRPRVALSQHLIATSTDDELRAVLTHESHHVRAHDPAKMVVTRTLRAALFLLPALGALHQRYLVGRELAADRRAVRATSVTSLAGALTKSLAGPTGLDLATAAALSSETALEARLDQLETGHEPQPPPLNRHVLALTALGGAGLTGGVGAAMIGVAPLVARFCHCG